MEIQTSSKDEKGQYTVTGKIVEGEQTYTYTVQQVLDKDDPDAIAKTLMDQHTRIMATKAASDVTPDRVAVLQAAADKLTTTK